MPREYRFESHWDREEFAHEANLYRQFARRWKWSKRQLKANIKGLYETTIAGDEGVWHDNIHGSIRLSPVERELVFNPIISRLRGVKQNINDLTAFHFAMTHSRAVHSVGTMHFAGRIARHLKLPERTQEELRLAGLLHDVGHFAFSHSAEPFIRKRLGKDHDQIAEERMRQAGIPGILARHGYDFDRIVRLTHGEGLGEIVTEYADRMDYLMRDFNNTGLSPKARDGIRRTVYQLTRNLALHDGRLCVRPEGIPHAQRFARYRTQMFGEVYMHPTVMVTRDLLTRAIQRNLQTGRLKDSDLTHASDEWVKEKLRGPEAEVLQDGMVDLKYHPVFAASMADLTSEGRRAVQDPATHREIRRVLKRHLKPHQFSIVAVPDYQKSLNVRVLHADGRVERRTLNAPAPDEHRFFFVAATENLERARAALQRTLGRYVRPGGSSNREVFGPIDLSLYRGRGVNDLFMGPLFYPRGGERPEEPRER